MAEFVEVAKQWRRMCLTMGEAGDNLKCRGCPMGENRLCTFEISDIQDDELSNAQSIIETWAADNPPPKYPTWAEFLEGITGQMVDGDLLDSHIPDDIAQALHIKPKGDDQ